MAKSDGSAVQPAPSLPLPAWRTTRRAWGLRASRAGVPPGRNYVPRAEVLLEECVGVSVRGSPPRCAHRVHGQRAGPRRTGRRAPKLEALSLDVKAARKRRRAGSKFFGRHESRSRRSLRMPTPSPSRCACPRARAQAAVAGDTCRTAPDRSARLLGHRKRGAKKPPDRIYLSMLSLNENGETRSTTKRRGKKCSKKTRRENGRDPSAAVAPRPSASTPPRRRGVEASSPARLLGRRSLGGALGLLIYAVTFARRVLSSADRVLLSTSVPTSPTPRSSGCARCSALGRAPSTACRATTTRC